MIEGTKISVKKRFGYDNFNSTKIFDTTNTFFIGLGVFPEFNKPANDKPSIGFLKDQINDRLNAKKSEQLGFSGELFGRFTGGLLQLDPLTKPELETILKQGVVSEYSNRLEYEGFKLEIEDECYSLLATQALDLGTNARGLQSSFSNVLQEAEYELKSSIAATNIRLFLDNNDIKYELKTCFPDNLFCNQTKSCG
jgi:ATP-dependent Clp protease ATP-binding subunit ClpX